LLGTWKGGVAMEPDLEHHGDDTADDALLGAGDSLELDQPPGHELGDAADTVGEGHAGDLYWQGQSEDGLCVPTSVAMLVSEWKGNPFSQFSAAEVEEAAKSEGLLEETATGWSGMTCEQAVTLLDHYGIKADVTDGSLATLAEYLSENRQVILAVDSDELWYGKETDDTTGVDADPDHAVRITGIDLDRGVAVIEDPGDPQGSGKEIPLGLLEDAWADSGHEMVVTEGAPPSESESQPSEPPPPDPSHEHAPETHHAHEPSGGWTLTNPAVVSAAGAVILPVYVTGKAVREWQQKQKRT
jgi:hypothetical protein